MGDSDQSGPARNQSPLIQAVMPPRLNAVHILVMAALMTLYLIFFTPLFYAMGDFASGLVIFPVMVIAWFTGLAGGLTIGVLVIPLNYFLITLAGADPAVVMTQPSALIGYFLILLAGIVIGSLSDLLRRYRGQAASLMQERARLESLIGEREEARLALDDRERIVRDLFDGSPDAIFVEDMDGIILEVNQAACDLHRMNREDLIGVNVVDLHPPEDRPLAQADFGRLKRGDSTYLESHSYSKDGEKIPVEIKAGRIVYRGQEALLLHVRDITERRMVDQELERQFRELLLLNKVIASATSMRDTTAVLEGVCKELALALDIPMVAFALGGDDGTFRVVAEYLAQGYPSALNNIVPVEGNPIATHINAARAPFVVEDVREDDRLAEVREVLLKRGTISLLVMPIIVHEEIIGTVGLDSVVRRAFQPHEISLVRNVAASVGQALSNARLIEQLQAELAERKRAESELKQAKEAAEAASRAKSAFLAQMSHELRTPLNSIIGYADMIMQGMYGELNEKQNNRLERVTRNGHHLLQIINDILDLSKIEAGYLDIDTHPFIIEGAVNECLTAMTPLATRKGLSLKGETPEELSAVKADRGRTVQILNNLVGNAVKFTEQGGITVTVKEIPPSELESLSTRLRPGDSPWVLVQVKDTGIGISQEHLDAVFEEFHQVDNTTTRQYEGTGLGLAISRRLARLMRGDLWAESAVGEGSTFSLLLPTTTESSGESRTSIVRAPTTQDGPSPLG